MPKPDVIERGNRAQEILGNEVYRDAYAMVEQELIRQWQQAKSQRARERLWVEQMLLRKVKTQLESVMSAGMLERKHLPERVLDLVRAGLR